MTALTQNAQRPVMLPAGGLSFGRVHLQGYTNNSGAYTVYHGSILAIDATDASGYATNVTATPASGDVFMGIAVERQDVTILDLLDGSKDVSAAKNGVWGFPVGALTQANVGAPAYAHDDNLVDATSSNGLKIGVIEAVDATYIWVNIASMFAQQT